MNEFGCNIINMGDNDFFGAASCESVDDKYACVAMSTEDGKRLCYFKQRGRTCHPLNRSAAVVIRDLENAHTASQRRRAFKRMQRLLALSKFNEDFAFADVGHQVAEVIAADKRLQRIVKHQLALQAKESNDEMFMKFVKHGIPVILGIAGMYYGWDRIIAFLTKFWTDNAALKRLRELYDSGAKRATVYLWAWKTGAPVPQTAVNDNVVKAPKPPQGYCAQEFCQNNVGLCLDKACTGCDYCKLQK